MPNTSTQNSTSPNQGASATPNPVTPSSAVQMTSHTASAPSLIRRAIHAPTIVPPPHAAVIIP